MSIDLRPRPLGELIELASGQVDPRERPYATMPHVGGDNIESGTGRLSGIKTAAELNLKSGKYLFDDSYILYSKIRPALNKVATPTFDGICSADIYPLRPINGEIDKRFLVYTLRSKQFLAYTEKHSTRTNIPKINRPALLNFTVPLPPLPEQKRIADILDKADTIRRKRTEQQVELTALVDSQFLEVFGDPLRNPRGWKEGTFNDRLTMVQYGPRYFNESYSSNGVRIVRITDLDFQGRLDYSAMPLMDVSKEDKQKSCLHAGDVLLARSGATVGKTALIDEGAPECIAGAYFIRLRFTDDIAPLYAQMVLRSSPVQRIIAERSKQSAQQNFNGPAIRELPLPAPPVSLQNEFVSYHRRALASGQRFAVATMEADKMFNSLVQRAFKGEL